MGIFFALPTTTLPTAARPPHAQASQQWRAAASPPHACRRGVGGQPHLAHRRRGGETGAAPVGLHSRGRRQKAAAATPCRHGGPNGPSRRTTAPRTPRGRRREPPRGVRRPHTHTHTHRERGTHTHKEGGRGPALRMRRPLPAGGAGRVECQRRRRYSRSGRTPLSARRGRGRRCAVGVALL